MRSCLLLPTHPVPWPELKCFISFIFAPSLFKIWLELDVKFIVQGVEEKSSQNSSLRLGIFEHHVTLERNRIVGWSSCSNPSTINLFSNDAISILLSWKHIIPHFFGSYPSSSLPSTSITTHEIYQWKYHCFKLSIPVNLFGMVAYGIFSTNYISSQIEPKI